MRRHHVPLVLLAACGGDLRLDDDLLEPDDTDLPGRDETDPPRDTDRPPVETDVEPPEDTDPPVDPRYDEAVLVVKQPRPGSIHLLAAGVPLEGWVQAKDGTRLPVDDLRWQVAGPVLVGPTHTFRGAAGVYDVGVSVRLPNGDRLVSSIGGVRLQSPYTGVWAGSVTIVTHAQYQGQPVQTSCIGPFDFQVDMAGRVLAGEGGCLLPLVVTNPIDFTFTVAGDVRGADVTGRLGVAASIVRIPVPWEGGFESETRLVGGFDLNLFVAQVEATLAARKLSPLLPP